jgi:hypothetical protein
MKKRNVKTLKLSKQKIVDFKSIKGGRPEKSFYPRECGDPEPQSDVSCFIESNCIGCTVNTKDTYNDC